MTSTKIRREIESFQYSVKALSAGLKSSGTEWKDEKYKDLSKLVQDIASSSKRVIATGDRVCETIDKFKQIADERI